MSVRRSPSSGVPSNVAQLQKELADLKSTAAAAPFNALQAPGAEGTLSFDSLTENEKSAASLGVHPESWKPIGFLNNAHYETLIKSNALDNDLARRIEVRRASYRLVSPHGFLTPPLTASLSCLAQAYKVVAEASE
jgi:hypothetical protein